MPVMFDVIPEHWCRGAVVAAVAAAAAEIGTLAVLRDRDIQPGFVVDRTRVVPLLEMDRSARVPGSALVSDPAAADDQRSPLVMIPDGPDVMTLQAGGASRGCIPASPLDLAIDTEDREGATIMIGTGGIIVLDDRACMVDMVRSLVGFFLEESCGKCVLCREGTRQMQNILDRVCEGRGTAADPGLLERLARTVRSSAVCGMGGMAPGAVLATLGHFREAFESHIRRRECSAGVCEVAQLSS